jgi:hypothetical protein
MKKRLVYILLACGLSLSLAACGGKEQEEESVDQEQGVEDTVTVEESAEEVVEEETRDGMYRSELTNEWIDESLKNQRPIAVMVDNEKAALPHYGTSEADVVYEMMNSTMNGHITRLMVLVKDWESISQLGSIRSTRTTNLQLAPEWNAIVCHDGGPFYIDYFLVNPYVDNLNGGFSRVNNGKSREFTEYILSGDLDKKFANSGISTEYTQYYQGAHFQFASETNPIDLSTESGSISCTNIELPFDHNKSCLEYIADNGTYRYSEYGSEYKDAGNGEYMEFTNVIIQECKYEQYDDNGYMNFWVKDNAGMAGYYITGGEAIPVTWSKQDDIYPTKYYDADGNEITLNTGKTYIALVADDVWDELVVE